MLYLLSTVRHIQLEEPEISVIFFIMADFKAKYNTACYI